MAMEENKKRVVNIEIEDDVRRLTITGQDEHDNVVMREELSDDDLDTVTGGVCVLKGCNVLQKICKSNY